MGALDSLEMAATPHSSQDRCINSVSTGVGNIHRAEVLFRHQLDPFKPGHELRVHHWQELWTDLVGLMGEGVRLGRIDTVRPQHDPARTGRAPRRDRHGGEVYVYRRAGAPCLVCGTAIAAVRHVGRNLYWSPTCQRPRVF